MTRPIRFLTTCTSVLLLCGSLGSVSAQEQGGAQDQAVAPAEQGAEAPTTQNPRLVIETSKGNIEVELFSTEAPKTVENFLGYVKSGFYNGTVFHRVMPGFMVQGGGFTADLKKKRTEAAVENESKNGLSNERGTLAMARLNAPHTATSQFFINLVHNDFLDHGKNPRGWGYAVFGKVLSGMEVADAIAQVPRGPSGRMQNVPKEAVTIYKIKILDDNPTEE